jgi:hypothetical protein
MSQTKAQLIDPVDGTIVNADINASAAIAGSKISPDFGSQNIVTTGSITGNDLEIDSGTLSVDASNNRVGIGTTSPQQQLHIGVSDSGASNMVFTNSTTGTSAGDGFVVGITGGEDAQLNMQESANLKFSTADTERMRIDSSGRVLIGTTALGTGSADNLVIADSADCGITIRSGSSSGGNLFFTDLSSGDQFQGYVQYDHGNNSLAFGTQKIKRMSIDSSGHVIPAADSTYNIGSNSVRFANGYFDTLYGDGSNLTNITSTTINNNADNRVMTGSASANTLEGEPGLRFFGDDNLLEIGTNTGTYDANHKLRLNRNSDVNICIRTTGNTTSHTGIAFGDNDTSEKGFIKYFHNGDSLRFSTNGSERVRIDSSGNFLIGASASEDTTGNSGPKLLHTGDLQIDGNNKVLLFRQTNSTAGKMSGIQWWNENGAGVQCAIFGVREAVNQSPSALAFYTTNNVDTSSNNGEGNISERMRINSAGRASIGINAALNNAMLSLAQDNTHLTCRSFATGGYDSIIFRSANTTVGKVFFNSGGTQYHTSSDYRRKENVVELTGAIDRIKTLLPKRFNFITEPSVTRDGFLAHEVTAVPEAIQGTKDQVATEKDVEDGKADSIGDPIYQTIDQSALVPLLTAAIKELISRVETLEAA